MESGAQDATNVGKRVAQGATNGVTRGAEAAQRPPAPLVQSTSDLRRGGSRVDAVAVTEDGEFAASFKTIAALAVGNKLPSIGSKEYAEAGGLIGYGVNILSLYRRAAYFIDKILKGSKPADLPIEQPTRFDFVINLKAAKTLGLTVPSSLLSRADELID